MGEVPRNTMARTAKLASLPLGIAGRAALGFGRRIGGASAEAVAAELQQRTAEQLFAVLGELKGGAMKVGQAMSVMEAALPEELAAPYRATLTKLQDSAPALPAGRVQQVMAEEFGPRWRTMFARFDDEPVAAASIGQVHRGLSKDGRELAIKVQYPGAADALMNDINQLSRVMRVSASWVPGLDLAPILDELKERLEEELDYRLEAYSQDAFATAFDGDPHVVVPALIASSEHVIVSEWIDGTPLSEIIANGSQEQRDLAAQRYLDFLMTGPAKVGMLHADPHPGNFRLTDDGRLGVLDFGAVNRLPDGMPPVIGEVVSLILARDAEGTLAALRDAGFVLPSVDVDSEQLRDYLEPFCAPLETETFTFSRDWLRGLTAHLNDPRKSHFFVGFKLNLPPEFVLIHRVWIGGIGVLCQIGGTVHGRASFDRNLPGCSLPPTVPLIETTA